MQRTFIFIPLILSTALILCAQTHALSYRVDDLDFGLTQDGFHFTPDGNKIVYNSSRGLYVTSVQGGVSTQINTTSGGVDGFRISPDSQSVAYIDDEDIAFTSELYAVSIDGGGKQKLNNPIYPEFDIREQDLRFTPDSQYVVFKAPTTALNKIELFSSPISNGGATRISAPIADGYTVTAAFGDDVPFAITSDSSTVVYVESPKSSSGSPYTLYAVPLAGGTSVSLSQTAPGQLITPTFPVLSPDESFAYYAVYSSGKEDAYRAAIDGSLAPDLISPPDGNLAAFRLSKDGRYMTALSLDHGAYSISVESSTTTQINNPALGAGEISNYLLSPDGNRVVMLAAADSYTKNYKNSRLFSVPIEGGSNTSLTPEIVINDYGISPDGEYVVFRSGFMSPSNRTELFSVPIDGGQITQLNSPLFEYGSVLSYQFTPGGKQVVYLAKSQSTDSAELFRVPTGGGSALRIDADLPGNTTINYGRYEVSSDGRHVVYVVVNRAQYNRLELHIGILVPEPATLVLLGGLGLFVCFPLRN